MYNTPYVVLRTVRSKHPRSRSVPVPGAACLWPVPPLSRTPKLKLDPETGCPAAVFALGRKVGAATEILTTHAKPALR